MKYIYLLLAIFSSTLLAFGQISITQNDMFNYGETVLRSVDTLPVMNDVGPSGANQNWIFDQVSDPNNVVAESASAVDPSTTPNAANFSTSNLALQDFNGQYMYLSLDQNAAIIDGIAAQLGPLGETAVEMSPGLVLHQFPRTFGSSFMQPYGFEVVVDGSLIDPTISQVRLKRTGTVNDQTDGWGSITTPYGTFDCLRNRRDDNSVDSIWIMPIFPPVWTFIQESVNAETVYQWHANNGKLPVAEMTLDSVGNVARYTWKSGELITSLEEQISDVALKVFPNPTSDVLYVSLNKNPSKNTRMTITNSLGQVVYTIDDIIAKDLTISTNNWHSGIYTLTILSKNGQYQYTERIMICN